MAFLRYYKKIQLLDSLIRRKATGNQETFAKKVGMSKSLLNLYLAEMKEMGFPICYSKGKNSYYYLEDGRMVSSLFERYCLNNDELKNYAGESGHQIVPPLMVI